MNEESILLDLLKNEDVRITTGNKYLCYDDFDKWQVYAPARGRRTMQCLVSTDNLKEAILYFLKD